MHPFLLYPHFIPAILVSSSSHLILISSHPIFTKTTKGHNLASTNVLALTLNASTTRSREREAVLVRVGFWKGGELELWREMEEGKKKRKGRGEGRGEEKRRREGGREKRRRGREGSLGCGGCRLCI